MSGLPLSRPLTPDEQQTIKAIAESSVASPETTLIGIAAGLRGEGMLDAARLVELATLALLKR